MARKAWWWAQFICDDRSKELLVHLFTNKGAERDTSDPLPEARLHLPNGPQPPRIALPAGHKWPEDTSHQNGNWSAQPTCCDLTGTVSFSVFCPHFLQRLSLAAHPSHTYGAGYGMVKSYSVGKS